MPLFGLLFASIPCPRTMEVVSADNGVWLSMSFLTNFHLISLFWPLSAHYGCRSAAVAFLILFFFIFYSIFFVFLLCGIVDVSFCCCWFERCGLSGGNVAVDLPLTHPIPKKPLSGASTRVSDPKPNQEAIH